MGYNGTFPGPTISVEQGEPISLRMDNLLPLFHPQMGHVLDTSTHLHGSASLPQHDGYASDLTPNSMCKDYEYPNVQPLGVLALGVSAVEVIAARARWAIICSEKRLDHGLAGQGPPGTNAPCGSVEQLPEFRRGSFFAVEEERRRCARDTGSVLAAFFRGGTGGGSVLPGPACAEERSNS